ncbi:MAG: serine/threonine protein kinase [Ktedonobacteraceae bacterium]
MVDHSGQKLGNYRLIRLLGKGGFADVYLGEHIYLKTAAAIKVLHTQLTSEDMDGFLNEARTIAHLVHPHIVRVTDFGIEGETPFLVMDYAPNGTLRQRHPKGTQLPLSLIISYVKQVAGALQHAHNERLVHRDIKPENMLLGRQNELLLSDFGIALVAQSSRYPSPQEIVGTAAYMSPEQIQGKLHPVSDQYSLGIVVYEWLSGDRPFHGSFTELCSQHMFATPPPLREKISTISPDVEQVMTRVLAKDPHQRFMSIQAFADALEQSYQSELATFARPWPAAQAITPAPPGAYIPPIQEPSMSAPGISSGRPATNYATQAEFVTGNGSEGAPGTTAQEKVNVWSIGRRQLVAMLIGALLFAALFFLSDTFELIYFASITSIALACATLLFLGTVFGPWAGLFTGVGGMLIFEVLQNQRVFNISFGRLELDFAIAGFIAGLTLLVTKGRYNNAQAIVTAAGISIIGSFIGTYIAYFPNIGRQDLVSYIVIPSLILLPALLTGYNAIVSRVKRA